MGDTLSGRRVVFVGDAWTGSNARSLAEGFRDIGCEVRLVDTSRVTRPPRISMEWSYKRVVGQRAPWSTDDVLRQLHRAGEDGPADLLIGFKTIHLPQERLLATPAYRKVHYSPDDMSNPYNLTGDYLEHEHRWDLLVTTKAVNVAELQERSGVETTFVWSAYDPRWHFRAPVSGSPFPVAFIGNARPARVEFLARLAQEIGDALHVSGPDWAWRYRNRLRPAQLHAPAYGQDFSYSVARSTANLLLLNESNRDQHTCRTFELAAAGAYVLAQRTPEHESLFCDGIDVDYFDDMDHLTELLRHGRPESERAKMADSARRIVTASKATYADRAREIAGRVGLVA